MGSNMIFFAINFATCYGKACTLFSQEIWLFSSLVVPRHRNSHHVVKIAYQRHTQHSRGKVKKRALIQTYQYWYRIIVHWFRNKDTIVTAVDLEAKLKGESAIIARCEVLLR